MADSDTITFRIARIRRETAAFFEGSTEGNQARFHLIALRNVHGEGYQEQSAADPLHHASCGLGRFDHQHAAFQIEPH